MDLSGRHDSGLHSLIQVEPAMNRTEARAMRKAAAVGPAVGGKDKDNRGRTRPAVMWALEEEAVKVRVSTTNKEVEVVDVRDAAPKGRMMRATRVRTRI